MVERELVENLCVSIRGYINELNDARDIDWKKFIVNWPSPAMRESEKLGYAVPEIKVMK